MKNSADISERRASRTAESVMLMTARLMRLRPNGRPGYTGVCAIASSVGLPMACSFFHAIHLPPYFWTSHTAPSV